MLIYKPFGAVRVTESTDSAIPFKKVILRRDQIRFNLFCADSRDGCNGSAKIGR
jgi:hypothetical protein